MLCHITFCLVEKHIFLNIYMCVCVCVCVYVCMYVCMYMYMYVYVLSKAFETTMNTILELKHTFKAI